MLQGFFSPTNCITIICDSCYIQGVVLWCDCYDETNRPDSPVNWQRQVSLHHVTQSVWQINLGLNLIQFILYSEDLKKI